jgi:quaternary ammonium compound-resistance protein SugE
MAWLILVASGVLEAVWATAMDRSDGFSRLVPSLILAASLLFSMAGLAFAIRSLPTGTRYAKCADGLRSQFVEEIWCRHRLPAFA